MVMPAGDNRTRYEITFKNTDVVLNNPTNVADAFTVFQNNENGMLTIYNTLNKDITSLMMYDVTGKLVLNNSVNKKDVKILTAVIVLGYLYKCINT